MTRRTLTAMVWAMSVTRPPTRATVGRSLALSMPTQMALWTVRSATRVPALHQARRSAAEVVHVCKWMRMATACVVAAPLTPSGAAAVVTTTVPTFPTLIRVTETAMALGMHGKFVAAIL